MISFQHASQGLGFSIDVQSRLFEAKWPDFLLDDSDVADFAGVSDDGAWRLLRYFIFSIYFFFFGILQLYTPQAPTPRNSTFCCTKLRLAGRKLLMIFRYFH